MKNTKTILKALLGATALSAFTAVSAHAGGTAAGTNVQNTFTLEYSVNGEGQEDITNSGNPTNFVVDRLIDLNVDSTADTSVTPGQTSGTLNFTLTNEGNDTQQYDLAILDENLNTLDASAYTVFYEDPSNPGVFIEFTGANFPELIADQTIAVQIRSSQIPSSAEDGQQESLSLIATTLDTSGVAVVNDTDGNLLDDGDNTSNSDVDNVFADDPASAEASTGDSTTESDGKDSATAVYLVASADMTATKEVAIFSEDGSACVAAPVSGTADNGYSIPGACVEYTITVTNEGSQDATAVTVGDILDENLVFVDAVASGFTGGAFSSAFPALGTDCASSACDVTYTGAAVDAPASAGGTTTATIKIYAIVKNVNP